MQWNKDKPLKMLFHHRICISLQHSVHCRCSAAHTQLETQHNAEVICIFTHKSRATKLVHAALWLLRVSSTVPSLPVGCFDPKSKRQSRCSLGFWKIKNQFQKNYRYVDLIALILRSLSFISERARRDSE